MARLDIYRNASGNGYLLDLQTDLLAGLNTRVVVPLMLLSDAPPAASRLNPVFNIDGEQVVMVTQFLASVPESELRTPVANLRDKHTEVMDALDLLFIGF